MPSQARPYYPAGPNDVKLYGVNHCFIDLAHPDPRFAEAADKALDVAGYTAAEKKAGPSVYALQPECRFNQERRDISLAIMEGYAMAIRQFLPAYAAQLKAWMAALNYGGYQSFDQAMRGQAETLNEPASLSVLVPGAEFKPSETIPVQSETISAPNETTVAPVGTFEDRLMQAATTAIDTRPEHLKTGGDAPPPPKREPKPAVPGIRTRAIRKREV